MQWASGIYYLIQYTVYALPLYVREGYRIDQWVKPADCNPMPTVGVEVPGSRPDQAKGVMIVNYNCDFFSDSAVLPNCVTRPGAVYYCLWWYAG
jgi:hypothetical protein